MKTRVLNLILMLALAANAYAFVPEQQPKDRVSAALAFVPEQQLKDSLLQMLARFTTYLKADFQACEEPNSEGELCGCFRSANTMRSNEDGVRSNADLGMVCAFLCRYARDKVILPADVSWQDLERMAMQSLVFAYSTHKANRLKPCADGRYWGSLSAADHVWESSLWAMSVAYSAFFQWERLSAGQRTYVYQLLKAECNYELERDIPTGYEGDTKAEENGWEADVLAATIGLFPDDELAPRWFERMRLFAVNSYSHPADAADTTVVDPDYDGKRVCDLYRGANLYDDYTLQNHNYFHTSYQNVVIQELGEAALALRLFQGQGGRARWASNSLMHNNRRVMDRVLKWLALSDGELAMPNGNDWSLFLYDQITSYSTMACILRDADALLLENRAYEMIRHRQLTTPDGTWLLRSDIGARRMGVEAHRVMMSWLMHHVWPTDGLTPTTWESFRQRHSEARLLPSQLVVRASTASRFSCFSWSQGLKSYTGYVSPHLPSSSFLPSESNLIVPFKAHNTGNLLGWYEVEGRPVNAVPVGEPVFQLDGDAWLLTARLLCCDSALDQRFAVYSTPGNAVVYIDNVRACADMTVLREQGGLLAVSTDPLTSVSRRFTFWQNSVNIDGAFSVVATPGRKMMAGEPQNVNSVMTTLLFTNYDDSPCRYRSGELVGNRYMVCYSGVSAAATRLLAQAVRQIDSPEGWGVLLVPDTDGHTYLLLSHFYGDTDTCVTPYGTFTLAAGKSTAACVN